MLPLSKQYQSNFTLIALPKQYVLSLFGCLLFVVFLFRYPISSMVQVKKNSLEVES